MTKFEIIFELLKAMNQGDSGYINERVGDAIKQYEQLVEKDICLNWAIVAVTSVLGLLPFCHWIQYNFV